MSTLKRTPKTLMDICIRKFLSYAGYCQYADVISEDWFKIYKNVFCNYTTHDGQLWHLRSTKLNFYFRRYKTIYYNLLRNMEYLKKALVDIAQSLFSTPWILLKIWIDSYAMILLDTVEEEKIDNLVRFREHFLEKMRDKRLDDVEGQHGVKYLEEQELEDSALKSLWRKCLGVDIESDSNTMLFPFPVLRRMLYYLKNYHEDHIQESSSSPLNIKKRDLTTFMS